MNKNILTVVIVAIVAFGGGYLLSNQTNSEPTHEDAHSETSAHVEHETVEIDAQIAPTVAISVAEDGKSGWNVTLTTENFTFTPENVNVQHVPGEGHAHLYVDGEKYARLYGPSFHYPQNLDGSHEFRVTLNANDHSEYAVDGVVIEATQTIDHSH